MSEPPREIDRAEQIAIDLFYGWGYAFYRVDNQLRADDLLFRSKAAGLLGSARAGVDTAEAAFRRAYLPAPTRAKPRPDRDAVDKAKTLERLSTEIGMLAGRIGALPVPEPDRMARWFHAEAAALAMLRDHDLRLCAQCEGLRSRLDGRDAAWILDNAASIEKAIRDLGATLTDRARLLD